MRLALSVVLLVTLGCGGESSPGPVGPSGTGGVHGSGGSGGLPTGTGGSSAITVSNGGCPLPPSGIFLIHYVQGAGNTCGALPDTLLNGDSPSMFACTGGRGSVVDTLTADGGCKVVTDVKGCAIAGGALSMIEQVTWAADYASASGIASFDISGSAACLGTYTVTVTKQ